MEETTRKKWIFKMTPVRMVFLALTLLAIAIVLVRMVCGLGATTNLSDQWPWGFWISFDVLLGVALAGGGYGVALIVYVLRVGNDRFYPIARSAMLTSLLGYIIVVLGLLIEVGQWFNFWRPFVSWGHHSVLFEVFWCISMYTIIQVLEFCEIATETVFKKAHKFLKKILPVLLIIGITLPTLHQSSLGGLYYLMVGKLDPLYWSQLLPPFFLISSFFVGPAMICLESSLSARALNHKTDINVLKGLVKISGVAMILYLALKIGDLALSNELGNMFAGTLVSNLFLVELGLGVVVPIILAFSKAVDTRGGLVTFGILTVGGVIMNRFDVVMVGMSGYLNASGASYFPSWTEFAVSAGLVSCACLIYLFIAENFNIVGSHSHGAKGQSVGSKAIGSQSSVSK